MSSESLDANDEPMRPSKRESCSRRRRLRTCKVLLGIVFLLILVGVLGFGIYVSNYSHAQGEALEACVTSDSLAVTETSDYIMFGDPATAKAGVVFYPGGKVEARAYAPLMRQIAEQGYFCVIVKMPFNLAVFNINGADGVLKAYPGVGTWYVAGHSLGGVMASLWVAAHTNEVAGFIMMGSYSIADMSTTDIRVLSIRGTEDKGLDLTKYEVAKAYLPEGFSELVIQGGNHADFGDYGPQAGDGVATITADEQRYIAAQAIVTFMEAGSS
jgi:hypothetical protein